MGNSGKNPWLMIVKWVACGAALLLFGLYIIDPIERRHFLLSRDHAGVIVPLANISGIVGGIALLVLYIASVDSTKRRVAQGQIKVDDLAAKRISNPVTVIAVGLFMPLMGFGFGYNLVRVGLPAAQHYFTPKEHFSAPFKIQGYHNLKGCRGMRASNPEFYDNELCGVSWEGNIAPYIGKMMIVEGDRSVYGVTLRRYTLPDVEIHE